MALTVPLSGRVFRPPWVAPNTKEERASVFQLFNVSRRNTQGIEVLSMKQPQGSSKLVYLSQFYTFLL